MSNSPSNIVSKWEWPNLFGQAYDTVFTKSNIKAGFAKCGISPFNQGAVPKSAFSPSDPFDTSFDHGSVSSSQTNQQANEDASGMPEGLSSTDVTVTISDREHTEMMNAILGENFTVHQINTEETIEVKSKIEYICGRNR